MTGCSGSSVCSSGGSGLVFLIGGTIFSTCLVTLLNLLVGALFVDDDDDDDDFGLGLEGTGDDDLLPSVTLANNDNDLCKRRSPPFNN